MAARENTIVAAAKETEVKWWRCEGWFRRGYECDIAEIHLVFGTEGEWERERDRHSYYYYHCYDYCYEHGFFLLLAFGFIVA